MPQPSCQPIRYCWDAEKVKNLIRLRAELSPLFTGKRNASKYAWTVVEQELNVPLPLSKIIKKWNNLLQEYKAIKLSEEPKRREWPFFTLMDLYFSDQVNDPTLRLFSSTKTFGNDTLDDKEDYSLSSALAAVAASAGAMSGGSLMDITDLMHESKIKKSESDLSDELNIKLENNNNSSVNNKNNHNNNNNNTTTNNNNNNNTNNNTNNSNNVNSINSNSSSINNNNNNSSINNNNNNNSNTNNNSFGQTKRQEPSPNQPQQLTPDYDDNSEYGNDIENTRNDILNRANEHHNIDQYLLSWNNFHGNMCKGFHNLQKDGQMVDVTIAAGGKIFKAHKLVLSVCSPYFQRIFLENPSTHPILFMTDVNSNYMAGLLDFMYSGQVNVKYDDLPSFLKVAEAMQIKGLHTESTNDHEEKDTPKHPTSVQNQQQQQQHQQSLQNQHRNSNSTLVSNKNRVQQPPTKYIQSPTHLQTSPFHQSMQDASFLNRQTLNLSQNRNSPKDVSQQKTNNNLKLNEDIQNNNNNNNSSNANTIANNNTNSNINNNNNSKYVIQQANISNKLLDNQKYPKYYSKRKLLAQYEQEMRNQKRSRPSTIQEDSNRNYKPNLNLLSGETNNNNNNNINNNSNNNDSVVDSSTRLLANIKMEPDLISTTHDSINNNNNNDDNDNIISFSLKQHSNQDSNDGLNLKTTPDTDIKLNTNAVKSS